MADRAAGSVRPGAGVGAGVGAGDGEGLGLGEGDGEGVGDGLGAGPLAQAPCDVHGWPLSTGPLLAAGSLPCVHQLAR